MSTSFKGTVMTVIAGIAWGLSGVSGQYLMAHGFSAIVLTNIRLLISGAVLLLFAYLSDKEKFVAFFKDKSSYISLILFAFFGLLLTQLTYLIAIAETNAGTATVLQYVCPVRNGNRFIRRKIDHVVQFSFFCHTLCHLCCLHGIGKMFFFLHCRSHFKC